MAPFDLDACIEKLKKKQLLGEALLREICEKTKDVWRRESNVVHVSSPVTVVGDIHGQFHDLIEIFRIGGSPPDTNYLFLGKSRYSDLMIVRDADRQAIMLIEDYIRLKQSRC
jgi:serine/threonine-protein phosphatase PPG1